MSNKTIFEGYFRTGLPSEPTNLLEALELAKRDFDLLVEAGHFDRPFQPVKANLCEIHTFSKENALLPDNKFGLAIGVNKPTGDIYGSKSFSPVLIVSGENGSITYASDEQLSLGKALGVMRIYTEVLCRESKSSLSIYPFFSSGHYIYEFLDYFLTPPAPEGFKHRESEQ